MKSCSQCGRQYPDSEGFCEADGTALTGPSTPPRGRGTTVMAETHGEPECPVCGGQASAGEVFCNFCGARLPSQNQPPRSSLPADDRPQAQASDPIVRSGPQEFGDEPGFTPQPESSRWNRRVLTMLGFSIAAAAALAAGAWFALYVSGSHPSAKHARATPASPTAAAPIVALTKEMPVQVQGDLAGTLERSRDSLLRTFENNKAGLANVYKNALSGDSSMRDGMVVRLHVLPDGRVDNGAVRGSTAGNPSFDAEVIEAMTSWKFSPAKGGGVSVDYHVIFAPDASAATTVESDLNTKMAALPDNEPSEYAFSPSTSTMITTGNPSPMASPAVAAASPPGLPARAGASTAPAMPTTIAGVPAAPSMPTPEATPPAVAPPARVRSRHRAPRELAALSPRKRPLIERVNEELQANRKLRGVQAYSNGSVVTIFGQVFDKDDRVLAERTVRGIDGVSRVIDNITTETQKWEQEQTLISQALQNAGLPRVQVKVIGQSAYLSGEVKSDIDRIRAVTIAEAAAPVKVRENLITVAIGNMFGF